MRGGGAWAEHLTYWVRVHEAWTLTTGTWGAPAHAVAPRVPPFLAAVPLAAPRRTPVFPPGPPALRPLLDSHCLRDGGLEASTCLQCGNRSRPSSISGSDCLVRGRAFHAAPWELLPLPPLGHRSSTPSQDQSAISRPAPLRLFVFPQSLLSPGSRGSEARRNLARGPRRRFSPCPPRPSLSQGPPVAPVLVQPPPAWAQGFLSGPLPKPSPARCQEAFSNANLIMWLQILSQSIFPPRTNYRFLGKALRSLACGSYPSLQQHFTTLPSHTAVAALLLLPLGLCALPWPFPALPWPDIPRKYFLRNSSRRPSLSPGRTRCSLIYPTQPINRLIGIFTLFPSQIIIPSRARAMFCSPVFGLVPKTTLL